MDLEKIKTLLDFVGRSCVSELTVSEAGTTVVIRNSSKTAAAGRESAAVESQPAPVEADGQNEQADVRLVRSPMAGVLHRSPSPGAAPLVAIGDQVEMRQALCIVEAMKVFTTVTAPSSGIVKRILFEDGQEVGFGDPLVEIV
jgi:acetyl-CoA carboxylase biotin carboxyl carrier protein